MWKTAILVVGVVFAVCLVGTASAATRVWTNNGVGDSWCTPGNWSSGIPGSSDTAWIDQFIYSSPDRGPVIDCSVDVDEISGPHPAVGHTQVMDIDMVGGTVDIGRWEYRAKDEDTGTSIINISGSPTITIGGRYWRALDAGKAYLNISGDPSITLDPGPGEEGDLRGADEASGEFYFTMGGGVVECNDFKIGGNGGGEINLSGGRLLIGGNLNLGIQRGSEPIDVMVTGGLMRIGGDFELPSNASRAGVVRVNLYGGEIDCGYFVHGSLVDEVWTGTDDWRLDIEQGELRIKGDVRDEIDANVAAYQITGYEGEGTVVVEFTDGNTVVTAIAPDPNRALNPNPPDRSENIDPNTLLTWNPGVSAATHHIYFGTDFDDVNTATTSSSVYMTSKSVDQNSYDPCGPEPLELITTYYWRIDEERPGPQVAKGRVWQFTTQAVIPDPNNLFYYKFDESSGNLANDSSGYGRHGLIAIDTRRVAFPAWDPNGQNGGSLRFNNFEPDHRPVTVVQVPGKPLANINKQVSIIVWLKDSYFDGGQDNMVFDASPGGESDPHHLRAAVVTDAGEEALFRAGNDSNDVLRWDLDGRDPETLEGWHLWAFVKDELADTISIYFDGEEVASASGVFDTLVNLSDSKFLVGAPTSDQNYLFMGVMDDFKLYDRALSAVEVAAMFRGGNVGKAWTPDPYDEETDIARDVTLSWNEGEYAAEHDVYLGTNWDDVNDATTVTAQIYKGRQDPCEYVLTANLELNTTYYWRVDEINDSDGNSPWKGDVWEFTVANFISVDDMEPYDSFINKIWQTWDNPWGNGSFVELGAAPFSPVHGGAQSMEYLYDNFTKWDFFSYWSEAERTFDTSQDWTDTGVEVLTLFFYGDPGNDIGVTEQFSIGVEGTARVDVDLPDMNDLQVAEWQEWNIPLSEFSAATLTAIDTVYLKFGDSSNTSTPGGDGLVYFDDIRLYPPRCIPELAPALDFSGDCIVGFAEVAMLGDQWLMQDQILAGITAPDPCVLHYKFDESSGTTLADSSGNGYTGVDFNDVYQTPEDIAFRMDAGLSGNSFHFSHSSGDADIVGIKIPPAVFTDNAISQEITVAMWVKNAHTGETPDSGAYMLEFREWDGISIDGGPRVLAIETTGNGDSYTFHDNSESVSYDLDWSTHTEWNHYAFIRDAANLAIYVNGVLEETSDSNGSPIADPNLLYLGLSADRAPGNTSGLHDGFTGNIDDFQIFDYALTESQAGYVGTGGTGYVPLNAVLNIYDAEAPGSKAVNFKDYALLMASWLEEKLWPLP